MGIESIRAADESRDRRDAKPGPGDRERHAPPGARAPAALAERRRWRLQRLRELATTLAADLPLPPDSWLEFHDDPVTGAARLWIVTPDGQVGEILAGEIARLLRKRPDAGGAIYEREL
jgi:hypothetical protein